MVHISCLYVKVYKNNFLSILVSNLPGFNTTVPCVCNNNSVTCMFKVYFIFILFFHLFLKLFLLCVMCMFLHVFECVYWVCVYICVLTWNSWGIFLYSSFLFLESRPVNQTQRSGSPLLLVFLATLLWGSSISAFWGWLYMWVAMPSGIFLGSGDLWSSCFHSHWAIFQAPSLLSSPCLTM